jgi:hypothetical protein
MMCLRTTSRPYRMGHGRPLEPPVNSSTRDPQFATRTMGVVDTSSLRPAEGRRRGTWTSRRACPDSPEWAQARGLDVGLHLLDAGKCQYVRMALPRLAEISPKPAETDTSHTGTALWKNLAGVCTLLQGFGATPAGALARPHGTAQQLGGKKVPSGSTNLCEFLPDTTAKARGLLSGTAIRVP